jgi:hypothetical protein
MVDQRKREITYYDNFKNVTMKDITVEIDILKDKISREKEMKEASI